MGNLLRKVCNKADRVFKVYAASIMLYIFLVMINMVHVTQEKIFPYQADLSSGEDEGFPCTLEYDLTSLLKCLTLYNPWFLYYEEQ